MNTQQNRKTRRSVISPIVLSLLVVGIMGLVWSGTSAQAAGAQTAIVQATPVESTITIPVSGTLIEPDGTLTINGSMTVNSTLVTDADGTSPRVVLSFDFSKVLAQDALTGTGVSKTGGFQDIKIRPLQAFDVIPITCPYYTNNLGMLSAETWLVTTTLKFDVSTGMLAGGSATVGLNPYLSFTLVL